MGIWVCRLLVLMTLFSKIYQLPAQQSGTTIRTAIEMLKKKYSVMFVYDSSIDLDIAYEEKDLAGKDLKGVLKEIFSKTDIKYEIKDSYVLLNKIKKYTLSGYVYQDSGETVINATVFDVNTKTGTLTNEHGFYSMMLREGIHRIRVSYIGTGETTLDIDLRGNRVETFFLKSGYKLGEVVVTTDLNSPLNVAQTGKVSIKAEDFERGVYFMNSPDVVSTLHNMSGIASGAEPVSGLYVHGGDHDENLVLLDGAPLYHVNHMGGLFSAFNTDVVKNVDFYKSAFPARYGGRLSSVLDVRTRDGSMHEFRGKLSLGLMDGRLQLEGPIVKNTTSFNIGIRRTWLEIVKMPWLEMINTKQEGDTETKYLFHDINAKVSHIFSEKSRANICFYSGHDYASIDNRLEDETETRVEYDKFHVRWGSVTASANWEYIYSQKLFVNLTGVYTHNSSKFYHRNQLYFTGSGAAQQRAEEVKNNFSTIDDLGYRLEFDYSPNTRNRLRFGSNYMNHCLRPQDFTVTVSGNDSSGQKGGEQPETRVAYRGNEFTLFVEDEIMLDRKVKMNAGMYYSLFVIDGKNFRSLEPRLSLNYRIDYSTSFKASVTKMSQYIHRLSSTYLNMPTDCWIPSTARTGYSYSWQLAAGLYHRFPAHVSMKLEGFYKIMNNLIEYSGTNRLNPSAVDWEDNISRGQGKAYGIEYDVVYDNKRAYLNLSYTLSWNRRFFPDFHETWFYDRFDNRHKLNVSLNYKLGKYLDLYALWRFHSGNRFTLPQQVIDAPVIPGSTADNTALLVYDVPNNALLPAYHKLDCGVRFKVQLKNGVEQTWDLAVYNAYGRRNAFYAEQVRKEDGSMAWRTVGAFPLLPSFCYTVKF